MKKSLLIFFFIICLSVLISAQTTLPTDDVQFWNETTLTIPLIKTKDKKGGKIERLSLFFNGVMRVGRNVSRPVDERIGFGFDFKINKNLSVAPSYLYVAAQPYQGRRDFESRLRFAVNLEKKFGKFSIRDRNLVEYRFRNSRENSTRYRNKLQFSYPILKNEKEIFTPFAADEVYYDFQEKDWTRNEFTAGISRKINKNLTTEFFYLFRNNAGNVLKYINVFGVNLKFKID